MSQSWPANRSMMSATVIPVLGYPDLRAAVDWLCHAFGFRERLRIGDHRTQLDVDGGNIVILASPPGTSHDDGSHVMIRVVDVDAHAARAERNGARIVNPPTDYPFGERQYTAHDFAGRRWTFSQTIADVDPASWGGELVR